MSAFPDLSATGALLGEPSRAAMLMELCDGRALTAGELAARAGVTASTASTHLSKLVAGGLLIVLRQGRHRYSGWPVHRSPRRWRHWPGWPRLRSGATRSSGRFSPACASPAPALLAALVGRDWIRRRHGERAVELTEAGRRGLSISIGLSVPNAGGAQSRVEALARR